MKLRRRLRKPRGAARLRQHPLLLLTTCSVLVCSARYAFGASSSRERAIVEVGSDAARVVDSRAAERLVRLEIDDTDVPPPLDSTGGPPLYFRILAPGPTLLRVELWELGAPRGARNVSSAGSDTLRARRIALAAGELARQLRRKRLVEIDAASRAPSGEAAPQAPERGIPVYARLSLDASARTAAVGLADAWMAGPALGIGLGFSSGFRVTLGAAWLAGEAPDYGSSLRWLETGLSMSQRLVHGSAAAFSVGGEADVASVRLSDGHDANAAPPFDDWSARAGLLTRVGVTLFKSAELSFGPDVAFVLRPIRAAGADASTHRVSGLWLGATVALQLEP